MSLEEQEGVVDRLTEKGVVVGGTWFGFSMHLKGPRLTEAHLGHKVTVLFHTYMERPYIDVVKAIGEKVPGWKPPESPKNGSWGGQGRRISPEEIALKREDGVRIARSVAVQRGDHRALTGEKRFGGERVRDCARRPRGRCPAPRGAPASRRTAVSVSSKAAGGCEAAPLVRVTPPPRAVAARCAQDSPMIR